MARTVSFPIFLATLAVQQKSPIVHRSGFNFLREGQIWCYRNAEDESMCADFANVVGPSDKFPREVTEHPIPARR